MANFRCAKQTPMIYPNHNGPNINVILVRWHVRETLPLVNVILLHWLVIMCYPPVENVIYRRYCDRAEAAMAVNSKPRNGMWPHWHETICTRFTKIEMRNVTFHRPHTIHVRHTSYVIYVFNLFIFYFVSIADKKIFYSQIFRQSLHRAKNEMLAHWRIHVCTDRQK